MHVRASTAGAEAWRTGVSRALGWLAARFSRLVIARCSLKIQGLAGDGTTPLSRYSRNRPMAPEETTEIQSQFNYPKPDKDTREPKTSPLTEGPRAKPTGKIRTLDAGRETGSYENMFILRSWRGQVLNLLESSRISADVTWPGLPRETSSARGRLVDAALSDEISSMVDLNRTEGCWGVCWGPGIVVGRVLESRIPQPTSATMFAMASR